MYPTLRTCGVILSVLALTACRGSSLSQTPPPQNALTFNKDIAPILIEHCASCHRPGDPTEAADVRRTANAAVDDNADPWCIAGAPFSLIEYRDVRAHATAIVSATRSRAMPPWLPEPGFGDFSNTRRLRDEQIALIDRWVAQGAIEGDPADAPPTPTWPKGWQLGQPDLVVKLPQAYTLPPGGADVFRNFVIPVGLSSTRYVRAMEFRTDNPRVLHHATVSVDPAHVSRRLDRVDAEPGFAAMPDNEVQNVDGWSPGKAPFMGPPDLAWPLGSGSDLVVQLHMLPTTKAEVIQPSIGLFFTDTPPTRAPIVITLQSKSIDIPAGQRDYAIEDRYVLPADVDVISVYPHAHYLAREMKGTATLPDGTVKPLVWIKAWDYNWQDKYRYASPLFLPKGTTVAMRFTYDNSDQNPRNPQHPARRVGWGPQSSDEMGALWLEVLPRHAGDIAGLTRDISLRSMRADVASAEMQVGIHPDDAVARNFLAARYLQAGRVPEAMAQLDQALRLKPDDVEAHSNLGVALQLQGRLADAARELRQAARLKPDDDRVHFNLANALQASQQSEEAVREYRRSIAINPENAEAHFNLALIVGPQGKLDEAVVHLRRALAINPQNADGHRNLGIALRLQRQYDQAMAEFNEALRIDPSSVQARTSRDELQQFLASGRR